MTRLAFIGGGNMAAAIIGGLRSADDPESFAIIASDPVEGARQNLASLGAETTDDNAAAAAGADVIMLAVKPQVLPEVCRALRGAIEETQSAPLVISIAAGIPIALIENLLGELPVVRCMPNTPALIRRGITALVANPRVAPAQRQLAQNILGAAGATLWMDAESDLDAVTAVSGSGPAYAFALIEAMAAAGTRLGLSEAVAEQLAIATVAGAGALAEQSDERPGTLRERVTSPGGTTAAALDAFTARDLPGVIDAGVSAAHARSVELGEAAQQQDNG